MLQSEWDKLKESVRKACIFRDSKPYITGNGVTQWAFDFRPLTLSGDALPLICDAFSEKIELPKFQVGGLETAAISLVAGMVMRSEEKKTGATHGFYVRKSRRKDGFQNIIEGLVTDEPIVLVDDVLNSGKSFVRQIEALAIAGRKVDTICCIIRLRDETFYEYFHERGIRIVSLFSLDDFPDIPKSTLPAPKKMPPSLFSTGKVLWRFAAETPSYGLVTQKSAPVLDDTKVYFGTDNGVVWALNQNDGSVVWRFQVRFGAKTKAFEKRILSTPAVDSENVYIGTYDGNMYALKKDTGSIQWVFRDADWIGSSPSLAPKLQLVFVGLEFGLWNKQGGIAALCTKTGRLAWYDQGPSLTHASPQYCEKYSIVVIGSNDGTVYAYDAEKGALRWSYKTGGAVRASCVFDTVQNTVCFGSEDGNIYVVNVHTGEMVHMFKTHEAIYSTPCIHEGTLFVGGLDKCIYAFEFTTGKNKWSKWTNGRIFSSPRIVNDSLCIGSNDGRLYELSIEDGTEKRVTQFNERIVNAVAYNKMHERIYVPTHGNELFCFEGV